MLGRPTGNPPSPSPETSRLELLPHHLNHLRLRQSGPAFNLLKGNSIRPGQGHDSVCFFRCHTCGYDVTRQRDRSGLIRTEQAASPKMSKSLKDDHISSPKFSRWNVRELSRFADLQSPSLPGSADRPPYRSPLNHCKNTRQF